MSDNILQLNYQGPPEDWKPVIAGLDYQVENQFAVITDQGYHDLDYLLKLLDAIDSVSAKMYRECESILNDFALRIDEQDEVFYAAHQQVYPSDETPGVVTFDEYKYLLENNNSNAAQYVIAAYENKVRGPSGTNALDISLLSLYVNSECKRIKEYINGYIGEVDDSAEFRTIEIFQDWAEDTQAIVSQLWKALKGQIKAEIPRSELDQLTGDKAREFQALFQVKLNVINKNIISDFSQLVKNWEKPASNFYNKNLGPAMRFRLKVGRVVTEDVNSSKFPVLFEEAVGTSSGLNSNFEEALSDCIKRNNMFFNTVSNILLNVGQRDVYSKYISQLSNVGKPAQNPFISSEGIQQADAILETRILDRNTSINSSNQSFYNAHADLYGIDFDDAHPQYVLRTGNSDYPITGNIAVADGVKIDGVDISEHTHDGVNSKKIHGSNIEYGTLSTSSLDLSDSGTFTPTNLKIKTVQSNIFSPGVSKVEVTVSFDVDPENVTGYEFEIIKLD